MMSDDLIGVAVKHQKYMGQALSDLAEHHPDDFISMCSEVALSSGCNIDRFRLFLLDSEAYYKAKNSVGDERIMRVFSHVITTLDEMMRGD